MARADGYVMVRRPARTPFVMSDKEWSTLSFHVEPRKGAP